MQAIVAATKSGAEFLKAADLGTLQRVLSDLGRLGVAVVSSAGNDATGRPMYPAAI